MKALRFFLKVSVLFFGITNTVWSQEAQQSSFYVVVGAFAQLENAVKYTDAATLDNFPAQYAIQTDRNLYYVFLLNVAERSRAITFLRKIKAETKYKDAWLYIGKLGDITITSGESKRITPSEFKPTVEVVVLKELPKRDSINDMQAVRVDSSLIKKPVPEIEDSMPAGKPFYFKLINSESGALVIGEIHLSESKTTQYQTFKGNEMFYLMPPKNNTGVYHASIEALGYRTANLSFNYKDPAEVSTGVGEKQETIFTFELARIKKGDYIDFNNVRFLTNSNILEPASQSELDGLAMIMKENKKFTVKIHGHCNGTESREIVVLGTSNNFFALDEGHNKKETATPKKLTEYRAAAVKNYLVSQGVGQSQITTKGEGAKMMLYPPSSTLANSNDRVEVEVLKAKK